MTMAKVTGPFLSLTASGSMGGALTASMWRGIQTMRIKSNPSNPKTLTQMSTRAAFAAGGKITKKTDRVGDVCVYLKSKTPSQQSWASYFTSEVLGTNLVNFDAAKAAYALVGNAAIKAIFDDAATQAGIESVDLDGTANTQISAGNVLWAAYAASYRLTDPNAPTLITVAAEADIFGYTEALTGVLPV